MRRLFTTGEALAAGLTTGALRWGERAGRWRRVRKGVYAEGPDDPSPLDGLVAEVIATRAVASGHLAAVLHGLDGIVLDTRPTRRRKLPEERVVTLWRRPVHRRLQTLVDVAATVGDRVWEQALESALRKRLVSIGQIEELTPELSRSRTPGGVI